MPWQEEEEEVTSGPWADIMEYSPVELEKLTTNRVSFPLTMLVHNPLIRPHFLEVPWYPWIVHDF